MTKIGRGWAWEFEGQLCNWVEPTKKQLLKRSKPTPEAKPAYVRIIKNIDYLKKTNRK